MSISERVRSCVQCPLSAKLDIGFKPQPGIGKPTSKILVVYDTLTRDDYLYNNYLTSSNGLLFGRIIEKAGLRREEMYITPLLKCYTSEKVFQRDINTCAGWLDEQIAALTPKVIIAFGSKSVAKFTYLQLKETFAKRIEKHNALVICLPSLFTLGNLGNVMLNYHIDRLKTIKEYIWGSQQATNTGEAVRS